MKRSGAALAVVCIGLAAVSALTATATATVDNFISLGDWGTGDAPQKTVAAAMAETITKYDSSFVLSVGDNFYPKGVESVTDPQWKTTWTDVYSSISVPFMITLGNHDHMPANHGQAEIDYSKSGNDPRWIIPSNWYDRTYTLANGQTLQILYLDTVLLCPLCTVQVLTQYVADGEYTQPELDRYKAMMPHWEAVASEEWAWLNATLEASTADWTIACGHYPVYSGGEHGSQLLMIAYLEPILQHYKLDAYINGHDHDMQHLQHDGLNFWVSGGGAKKGSWKKISESVWGQVVNGYMKHSFPERDVMLTTVFDDTATPLYSYNQTRRAKLHESAISAVSAISAASKP